MKLVGFVASIGGHVIRQQTVESLRARFNPTAKAREISGDSQSFDVDYDDFSGDKSLDGEMGEFGDGILISPPNDESPANENVEADYLTIIGGFEKNEKFIEEREFGIFS